MFRAIKILALASALAGTSKGSTIEVSSTPPANASAPLPEGFVSYSIEFAFFPDFAGISISPAASLTSTSLLTSTRKLFVA
jgi:hypothetical protein